MNKILTALLAFLFVPSVIFADTIDDAYNALALISTRSCCKVCSAGKACGDSCISKTYNCSKGVGCACNGGGSSGGGSNRGGGSNSGGSSSGGGSKGGSSNSGGKNSSNGGSTTSQLECPAIIARIDSLTYSSRKNYRCFPKSVNAENKSFVREPEDGSLNSKALINLSVKRVKCPKIIVDKRTKLFTTNAEYLCYESKTKATSAGFKAEG